MAHKRNAQEAFGKPQEQLSAFAAAKLAKQSSYSSPSQSSGPELASNGNKLAIETANTPYDSVYSWASTPDASSVENDLAVSGPASIAKIPFSTFIPGNSNLIKDDEHFVELTLKRGETLTLIGVYDFEVLESPGVISIAGVIIRPNQGSLRVYAPSTQPLPQIRAVKEDATIRIFSTKSGIRKLEKLSPLFRSIWNSTSNTARSFALLGSSVDDTLQHNLHVLEIDAEVDAVLRTISPKSTSTPRPCIMAIGAKSSGKSTFNRLLCNYIYTWSQGRKLLYLDLDPGQPEFGPPGQISLVEVAAPLLEPAMTHPASGTSKDFRLVRSHTIAATTFKDDPEHYKACVADLIQHVDEYLPVIANSCGWVSGLGASMLIELVSMLKITDTVILETLEDSLIESLRKSSPTTVFHRIPRRATRPSSRTPVESRAMQIMAYFHHRTSHDVNQLRWSGKAISRVRPWVVNYAEPNPGILAVMSYGQSPEPQFLAEVLDGSVVAIVVLEPEKDLAMMFTDGVPNTPSERYPAELKRMVERTLEDLPYIAPNAQGIHPTLNPRASQCIGLALIRCIDTKRKELHLITPLLDQEIAGLEDRKVVLVRGSFDPPEWAYLEDLFKAGECSTSSLDGDIRPWVSGRGTVGVESSVWRMRHPPMASAIMTSR